MLKEQRKRRRLTQTQLGKLCNLSQSYISELERDNFFHSPTIKQIIAISKALNINPLDLTNYFIEKELSFHKNK